jgi:HTH-type transcriptional regulator / antitoxin HipB
MSKDLGVRIRKERKSRSLSQRELGDLAGTGLNFVSQIERGKETVRLDKVLAIIQVLGLELVLSRGTHGLTIAKELR